MNCRNCVKLRWTRFGGSSDLAKMLEMFRGLGLGGVEFRG